MRRWRLECEIAVADEPVGCTLLSLGMPKTAEISSTHRYCRHPTIHQFP